MSAATAQVYQSTPTLQYIFRRYDINNDGEMDKREFFLFLYELGKKSLSLAEMESCFEYITTAANPGNAVSYDEFVKGVPKLYKCRFKPNTQDETIEDDLADAGDIEKQDDLADAGDIEKQDDLADAGDIEKQQKEELQTKD